MSAAENTLFLRLAGPMQSWGTSSRFQLRRTDAYPSKSGVLGLLLCAKGVSREDSERELAGLAPLLMGVRVDRPGTTDWDYHTAGAKIGMRKAKGGIKRTGNTKEGPIETLLSRRQYLYDASFLVVFQGNPQLVANCVRALDDPVWPVFLGRKCCVPSEPVFAGTGGFDTPEEALASREWQPRIATIDNRERRTTRTLDIFIEHPKGSPPPPETRLVYDVPVRFGYWSHAPRWVVPGEVTVHVGKPLQNAREPDAYVDPYGPGWDPLRKQRLEKDNYLCVFCKSPAFTVHHVDYRDVRIETVRSLCKNCHDACTMLEYGHDMRRRRIDPLDAELRPVLLRQIERLLAERRSARRRELLASARVAGADFFNDPPDSRDAEGP